MDLLRTPDDRFAALPDFPWEPRYATVPSGDGDGIRMAYVEAGPAEARWCCCCTVSRAGRSCTAT
ncbi:MAG: hypothetical protein ACXVWU_05900 [Nocardioides sp.]